MNHKILCMMAASCLLSSCVTKAPELSEEQLQTLVTYLPNQGYDEDNASAFTEEYFTALRKAWQIPDGGLGEIGNNEFLYYFVCGNDPCDSHGAKLVQMTMEGDTANVQFEITHEYGRENEPHTMKLVMSQDHWLIADYDNTLADMKEYVVEQREYLRSDDYKNLAQKILNDPDASEAWKEAVVNELNDVQAYFEQHP